MTMTTRKPEALFTVRFQCNPGGEYGYDLSHTIAQFPRSTDNPNPNPEEATLGCAINDVVQSLHRGGRGYVVPYLIPAYALVHLGTVTNVYNPREDKAINDLFDAANAVADAFWPDRGKRFAQGLSTDSPAKKTKTKRKRAPVTKRS